MKYFVCYLPALFVFGFFFCACIVTAAKDLAQERAKKAAAAAAEAERQRVQEEREAERRAAEAERKRIRAEREAAKAERDAERQRRQHEREAAREERERIQAEREAVRQRKQAEKLEAARLLAEYKERTLRAEQELRALRGVARTPRERARGQGGTQEGAPEGATRASNSEGFVARSCDSMNVDGQPTHDVPPVPVMKIRREGVPSGNGNLERSGATPREQTKGQETVRPTQEGAPEGATRDEDSAQRYRSPVAAPAPAGLSQPTQNFVGQRVAFTGKLSGMTRGEAIAEVERRGGRGYSGMPVGTTLLVVAKGLTANTAKLDKADEWIGQVRKITEAQFLEMIAA